MIAPHVWQAWYPMLLMLVDADRPTGFTLGQVATVTMLALNFGGLVWGAAKMSGALEFLKHAVEKAETALAEMVEKVREHTTLHELMNQWRGIADRRIDEHDHRLREVEREVMRMGNDSRGE